LPLLNITVLANNMFTAVTPAHTPGPLPVPLVVTSPSGTTVLSKAFTYSNGITVSPSTGPNNRPGGAPVDVQGVGFAGLNFMMTGNPDDKNAHVYLVRGMYDPAVTNGIKRNGELVECGNTMLVSDSELVCTMNLQASLTGAGASALPTRTVTADTHSDLTLANISPALSGSDQGERISGPGIAAGTTITQVGAGGTTATLSVPTGATNTGVTGIAPGTTIVNIGPDGTTANLSTQPTSAATGTSGTIMVSDPVPVPVGTYTVTVVSNGTVNAWPADANYTQSVLCSGSTFTVSDF